MTDFDSSKRQWREKALGLAVPPSILLRADEVTK
jgi:hypothetical protein